MKKLITSLQWLDKNLMKILLTIYIVLIPLYPKIPLRSVDYTYVAIRVEDLYVALIVFAFLIQVFRKKIQVWTKFLPLFILFWLAVLASYVNGQFIQMTIPDIHVGFLHFVRRIEYMMIFFIAASIVQTKEDFYYYLKVIVGTFAVVSIYGIGQKFLGWPAVQTMNAEYAKGYLLYLDSFARVSSTFGGHYDLAAYLVLLMPLVVGMYLFRKNIIYLIIFTISLLVLILTASRVSYGSYILAIIMYLLYVRKFRLLLIILILTAVLTPLSDNLTKRITRTFSYQKIYVDPKTNEYIVPKDMKPDDLPPGDFIIGKIDPNKVASGTPNSKRNDTSVEALRAKEQIRKTIVKEATKSGKTYTNEQIDELVEQEFRSLIPQNQLLPDISQSTRFMVEWPRAYSAFRRNPLLGKGPSSITEATDNDYLRWLGELGLIGTSLFMYILFSIMKYIYDISKKISKEEQMLYLGFVFGIVGLLINATYIDVFEASKVAYTFWMITGLFVATNNFYEKETDLKKNKLFNLKTK